MSSAEAGVSCLGWVWEGDPTFLCAGRGSRHVEDKVATFLHIVALQWASGGYQGLGTEEASFH